MWKRIFSLAQLAWALLKTLTMRLFPRRSALAQFASHYQSEGILPVTAEEAVVLAEAGRCIACGRCDAVPLTRPGMQTPSSQTLRLGGPSLMGFVLSGTRSLTDYDASATFAESLDEQTLREAEKLCPTGVPIGKLVHLVRGHAERMRTD